LSPINLKGVGSEVKDKMADVVVGKKAPDFTLYDINLKQRKLSEFFGKKLVLAFFPGAFTSVCTKEMCTFRDSMTRLNDLKAQVISVSVNDPWSNKGFAERNMLTFPLLSDYKRDVVKLYNIELRNFAGLKDYTVAKRSVFILDNEGVVRYKWVSNDPSVQPNYEEIVKELSKID